jgi:hypothetical protein
MNTLMRRPFSSGGIFLATTDHSPVVDYNLPGQYATRCPHQQPPSNRRDETARQSAAERFGGFAA